MTFVTFATFATFVTFATFGPRANKHLARVAVDDAHVRVPERALQIDLLHVLALDGEVQRAVVGVRDHERKLLHVAQYFLTDALASAVNTNLDPRTREHHRRAEHRHADRLAEAARGRDQDLLRNVVPAVDPQHLLVVPRKLARRLQLPEAPRACLQEVVVKKALVVASVPAERVQLREILATQLHVLQWLALCLLGAWRPRVRSHALHAFLDTVLQGRHEARLPRDLRRSESLSPLQCAPQARRHSRVAAHPWGLIHGQQSPIYVIHYRKLKHACL